MTPNLDRLSAAGTRFTNAYTASPMCVPTRAALACGRHVHQIAHWDSATPYDGKTRSWTSIMVPYVDIPLYSCSYNFCVSVTIDISSTWCAKKNISKR